jgi:thiol-disulfide isomerase/thioredoxin
VEWVSTAGRLLLAAILLTAGIAKLLDRYGTGRTLRSFRVPERLVGPASLALPAAEIALAAGLLVTPLARVSAGAGAALFGLFIAGIAAALRRGEAPDCHCFGQLHSEPAGTSTLVRNGLLVAVALTCAALAPQSLPSWFQDRTAAELTSLALGAMLLLALASLRSARTEVAAARAELHERGRSIVGLPPGTPAPQFTATDLDGRRVALEDLLPEAGSAVLTFVSPGCGPCETLLPHLARWQRTLAADLRVHVLNNPEHPSEQQSVAEQHGLASLLFDSGEVRKAFRVAATPSAVVVRADGSVAAEAAVGPLAIETLVRRTLGSSRPATGPA